MAPYGACEVAQSTARSKAQSEAAEFRKGFRRKNESAFEGKRSMLESAFEGQKEHARAMISSAKMLRRTKKGCSSSDFERQEAPKDKSSMLEQ